VALIGAGVGLAVIDPVAAVVISAIAIRECTALWRGESDECCAPIGFADPSSIGSSSSSCCSTRI